MGDEWSADAVASYDVARYLQTVAPGVDALGKVAALRVLAGNVEDSLFGWVVAARASGASWSEVGDALGVSKQAAQQRYGRSRI